VVDGFLTNPGSRVTEELVQLAEMDQSISDLSRALFLTLRKQIGSPDLLNTLLGVQYLGFQGEAPGARLIAAYLDVTSAGARLIPYVRNFNNSRRQQIFLDELIGTKDSSAKDWQMRATRLSGLCRAFPGVKISRGENNPWPAMRAVLSKLLGDVITGAGISAANRIILADLLRLETDAWEERIGRLAGKVNPFRVSSVQRVLPILGRADVNIRDLRLLVSWVVDGQDQQAFTRQGFRALEVLEDNEFYTIFEATRNEMKLQVLAGLQRGGRDNPLPVEKLGPAVAGLMALDSRLEAAGMKETRLDLLSAVALVQQHSRGGALALALDQEQEIFLKTILEDTESDLQQKSGPAGWSCRGFSLDAGQLILKSGTESGAGAAWPHGLPTYDDKDPGLLAIKPESAGGSNEDDSKKEDLDASAIKHLVMSNIMSVSVLLGFLRNPKVVSIPGLVAAVANRTRNPQIIETIARDRALYSGFANREVPLACLRSPCNVPPKTLRKFIHVKFVSKIDLKRMASDRTGTRKEIAREINKYIDGLC